MKKILFIVLVFFIVSEIHAQDTDSSGTELQFLPVGLYFEAIIPPFLKQIAPNKVPNIFAGATYADFGLGVTFFHDILKAQINYGFLTQEIYESLGGSGPIRYGGNVFGLKLFAGPEFNFGKILGSSWENISASFSFGLNFSCFDITPSNEPDMPEWMNSWNLQLEFPKITFPNRKLFRSFSLFLEYQIWEVPMDKDTISLKPKHKNLFFNNYAIIINHLVLGVRAYIF